MDDQLPKTTPVSPSGSPERRAGLTSPEKPAVPEEEIPKETGPEVKDYLTKLETGEEIQLPQPVTDDSGQPILTSPASQQVTITLPLTDDEMKIALHKKIIDSIRWLAEWCLRLIKITRGRISYRLEKKEAGK